MVIRKSSERGDGITRRTVTHRIAETTEEADALFDELDVVLRDPLARLRYRIEQARLDYAEWRRSNVGVFRGDETRAGLLLQVQIAGDEMERCLLSGDAVRAAAWAAGAGEYLAILQFKHRWEPHALSGLKSFEGGAGTRKATDKERRNIVCEIMAERGKGARDAFRIAEQRFPHIGSEASFKTSYYKKGV